MKEDVVAEAAGLVESLALGGFSMASYECDIAAYLLKAAGLKTPPVNGPYFEQAVRAAGLPNDKLLWVGGWPEDWKQMMEDVWFEGEKARAQMASIAMLDYLGTEGWKENNS